MEKAFYGKWILVTKCNFNQFNRLLGGFPVAVADDVLEGHRDGFYDIFYTPEYAPRTYCDFNYDKMPGLFIFFDTNAEPEGENVIRL